MGRRKIERGGSWWLAVYGEVVAFVVLGVSILTVLSLISYTPSDVGFNKFPPNTRPVNFVGSFGALWSWGCLSLLGLAAYWIPVLMMGAVVALLRKTQTEWGVRVLGGVGLLLGQAGWLDLTGWFETGLVQRYNLVSAGGFLGSFLNEGFFENYFGQVGAGIVFGVWSVGCFFVAFNLHPIRSSLAVWYFVEDLWERWWEERLMRQGAEGKIQAEILRAQREQRNRRGRRALLGGEEVGDAANLEGKENKLPVSTRPTEIIDNTVPKRRKEPSGGALEKEERESGKKMEEVASASIEAIKNYELPPLRLLEENKHSRARSESYQSETESKMGVIVSTLADYKIMVEPGPVTIGPTFTRYEVVPAKGVRVSEIVNLNKDLARTLRAVRVNILAPVPGKDTVGIEIPNEEKAKVLLRDIFESDEWRNTKANIPIAIGKDVNGRPMIADLSKMPHLLVAGTTGSGKSVCVNCIIMSLIFRFRPDELRLLMVDPKQVELTMYNSLPHLALPVLTDVKKVPRAMNWLVREMEARYLLLAKAKVRNITEFNERKKTEKKLAETDFTDTLFEGVETGKSEEDLPDRLPYIVLLVDEYADLMQTSPKEVEEALDRLAQKARAAGIHVILATQTPRKEVITGVVRANIPARIALQVANNMESRLIIHTGGAENLVGAGDLLFLNSTSPNPERGQGPYVSNEEIMQVVRFCARQAPPAYEQEIQQKLAEKSDEETLGRELTPEDEELIRKTLEVMKAEGRASTSLIQRRLRIGYGRGAWIMDFLEKRGIVGPKDGNNDRDILIDLESFDIESIFR
ncbi:MAG: DNA translocase FtsK 4TM domain-containing protein [Verrucomicrobiae bacterium]|nr:DNA translocase FtsK 4TM domain-containing protein [Verrucomicrobiae bacterium]